MAQEWTLVLESGVLVLVEEHHIETLLLVVGNQLQFCNLPTAIDRDGVLITVDVRTFEAHDTGLAERVHAFLQGPNLVCKGL